MAGVCWSQTPSGRCSLPRKGNCLYERTGHKANARRLQQSRHQPDSHGAVGASPGKPWQRALSLATEADERAEKVPMILDSLGELLMLRGELDEAREYLCVQSPSLPRTVTSGTPAALRTLARVCLAMEDHAKGLATAKSRWPWRWRSPIARRFVRRV